MRFRLMGADYGFFGPFNPGVLLVEPWHSLRLSKEQRTASLFLVTGRSCVLEPHLPNPRRTSNTNNIDKSILPNPHFFQHNNYYYCSYYHDYQDYQYCFYYDYCCCYYLVLLLLLKLYFSTCPPPKRVQVPPKMGSQQGYGYRHT